MVDQITNETIKVIKERVEIINKENIGLIRKEISQYLDFLETYYALPYPLMMEHENLLIEEAHVEELEEEVEVQKIEELLPMYRFERRIKGGTLVGLNAFVPERVVRNLEINHGDMLYAKLVEEDKHGNHKYEYKVAERKGGKDSNEFIRIPYAIVEKDKTINRYVVNKTATGEYVRIDGIMQTLILSEHDVHELKIKEEDIIELAYLVKNPTHLRIVWKYNVESIEETIENKMMKNKGTEKKERGPLEQVFKNKTIMMLGYEPGKASFRGEIERRGGAFLWASGKESEGMLAATLQKADVVIFMIGHVGHSATIFSAEYCKRQNIPFTSTSNFGRNRFLQTVTGLLESSIVA